MPYNYDGKQVTHHDFGMGERLFKLQWEWYETLLSKGIVPDGPTASGRAQQRKLAAWRPTRRRLLTPHEAAKLSANALRRALKKGHAKIDERGFIVSTRGRSDRYTLQ